MDQRREEGFGMDAKDAATAELQSAHVASPGL